MGAEHPQPTPTGHPSQATPDMRVLNRPMMTAAGAFAEPWRDVLLTVPTMRAGGRPRARDRRPNRAGGSYSRSASEAGTMDVIDVDDSMQPDPLRRGWVNSSVSADNGSRGGHRPLRD